MYALADAGACCSPSTYLVDPAWTRAICERQGDRFVLSEWRVNNVRKIIPEDEFDKGMRQMRKVDKKEAVEMGSKNSSQASRTRQISRGWQNGD